MSDPGSFASEEPGWRSRARERKRRLGRPAHIAIVLLGVLLVGGGFAWWLSSRENALTRAAHTFGEDWSRLDYPALEERWLTESISTTGRRKLAGVLEERGWTAGRPALELDEVRGTERSRQGYSSYAVAGFAPEARLQVIWRLTPAGWRPDSLSVPPR